MKRIIFLCIALNLVLTDFPSTAQEDTLTKSGWNHTVEPSFYVYRNDFFILPIYQADKDWLHLEARYNYEDMNTFSAWFGYNFTGGNQLEYTLTPMLGGIVGNTNGIAPGLELTFGFHGFELYSEMEYIFDLQSSDGNFFYNWTDFSYSPLDWLWFGVSAQQTKVHKSDLEPEWGFLLGGGYRWFGLTGYMFNLGTDDPYAVITLTVSLPE
jgi:hypothetical protein